MKTGKTIGPAAAQGGPSRVAPVCTSMGRGTSVEIKLTARAAAEYDYLRSGAMTPKMASQYLQEGRILLRTFAETLQDQYPYPDLQLRLANSLQAYEPESAPGSVARKVQNWLGGRSQPTKREDVFRIAFALDLTEAQASFLLGQCTGYGLHYRDPKDVINAWFLRNDRGYNEAQTFFNSLPPAPRLADYQEISGVHLTRELQSAFATVYDMDGLRKAYLDHMDQFGYLHLRAYRYFDRYLRQLIHPQADWTGVSEEDYSLETVMERYLSLHMPSGRKRDGYSVAQKLLKQNWPNATALKNIRAHREDVPRKLLLLLYVITENVVDEDYHEADEDYLTLQERLEDHWWVLNAILLDCGMPTLDPRNATDWLVLYALTAEEDESMSERMAQVIDHLFADIRQQG